MPTRFQSPTSTKATLTLCQYGTPLPPCRGTPLSSTAPMFVSSSKTGSKGLDLEHVGNSGKKAVAPTKRISEVGGSRLWNTLTSTKEAMTNYGNPKFNLKRPRSMALPSHGFPTRPVGGPTAPYPSASTFYRPTSAAPKASKASSFDCVQRLNLLPFRPPPATSRKFASPRSNCSVTTVRSANFPTTFHTSRNRSTS